MAQVFEFFPHISETWSSYRLWLLGVGGGQYTGPVSSEKPPDMSVGH